MTEKDLRIQDMRRKLAMKDHIIEGLYFDLMAEQALRKDAEDKLKGYQELFLSDLAKEDVSRRARKALQIDAVVIR